MIIKGITGIYKKNYLNNNLYRFDYSHSVIGYLDSKTDVFTDEGGNVIPSIRDVDFLDSKENYGQSGFASFQDSLFDELDIIDNENYCLLLYDNNCRSSILLVSVLEDIDKKTYNTVVTSINLSDIHKQSIDYYMDFIDNNGNLNVYDLHTENPYPKISDLSNFVKADYFTLDELNEYYDKYNPVYIVVSRIVNDCENLIDELQLGTAELDITGRKPEFDIKEHLKPMEVLELLDSKHITPEELDIIYTFYKNKFDDLDELINSIENMRNKKSITSAGSLPDENEAAKNPPEENKDAIDDEIGKYSLDDLKSLRSEVKKYLVGQDDSLRRFTLELRRIKNKEYADNVGILLSGDSGVGKTFMVQLVAKCLNIPFVRVDSTELTVPGYVGKDIEEVMWELYEVSGNDKEKAEHGIVFFDEIDKKGSSRKDDVAGKGVLNNLLALLDGKEISAIKNTKSLVPLDNIKKNKKNMIFVVAGSFPDVYKTRNKELGFNADISGGIVTNKTPSTNVFVEKAMMTSDFMNRLPIRIRLKTLTVDDFEDNFKNGEDSPLKWEEKCFLKEGVKLSVTPEFIKKASELSLKEQSGFRGSKGVILNATAEALDEVVENKGKYEEIILSDETLDNPFVYEKVLKK